MIVGCIALKYAVSSKCIHVHTRSESAHYYRVIIVDILGNRSARTCRYHKRSIHFRVVGRRFTLSNSAVLHIQEKYNTTTLGYVCRVHTKACAP